MFSHVHDKYLLTKMLKLMKIKLHDITLLVLIK